MSPLSRSALCYVMLSLREYGGRIEKSSGAATVRCGNHQRNYYYILGKQQIGWRSLLHYKYMYQHSYRLRLFYTCSIFGNLFDFGVTSWIWQFQLFYVFVVTKKLALGHKSNLGNFCSWLNQTLDCTRWWPVFFDRLKVFKNVIGISDLVILGEGPSVHYGSYYYYYVLESFSSSSLPPLMPAIGRGGEKEEEEEHA